MGGLRPESVQFKIEPDLIPGKNITRNSNCPTCRGGPGDIWKCLMTTRSGTQRDVAVKSIRVPGVTDAKILKAIGKRVRREAYVWMQLEHDHILPFEGVTFAEEFGPLPALVSPWMEEGSLENYLRRFSRLSDPRKRELVRYRARRLDSGRSYPNPHVTNILVDSTGRLRLADFGLSMILAEAGNATFNSCHPGNTRWMPPEALRSGDEDEDEAQDEKPTEAWDVYSYGCIVFQIFLGNQPYAWIASASQIMSAIHKGRAPFKDIERHAVYKQFSPCLNKMSAGRPTIDDIMKLLGSR
ncbi:kinase-like domain-containing protein [Suillus variegatus]|nr:kinase-like domain-containing protein [Suillus variegatus]